jgi:hypothetical protein
VSQESKQEIKSEIRSTKSETNSNDRNPKFKTDLPTGVSISIICALDLFRISDFDIRISAPHGLCV